MMVVMTRLYSRLPAILSFFLLTSCVSSHPESLLQKHSGEINFVSSLDRIPLKGKLERPAGQPIGAVLMLTGSGKTDSSETIPAEKTFTGKTERLFDQLSDAAIEAGFITLRYNKRGVLDSNGNVDETVWKTADRDHLIADAVDAAKLLSRESGFKASELIILGHSEGTIIATETALRLGGEIQALLLFGAQARSMKEMFHYQIVESRSKQTSGGSRQSSPEKEYIAALKMIETETKDFAPDGKPINWYRQHLAAPANAERLKMVRGKKFVFQGEIDPQTPIEEVARFQRAGVSDLKVFTYPSLGHGFSPDKEGKPTLGPIDPSVLRDLKSVLSGLR